MTKRKRSRDDENGLSVGDTLSRLNRSSGPSGRDLEKAHNEGQPAAKNDVAGEWHVVESRKKRKKHSNHHDNYPSISHSSHARLQSCVKIGDLQNLALYLLADGTAPQWCSVRHHLNVRKVVVLLVPGLESDMFQQNGMASLDRGGESTVPEAKTNHSPDNYYPTKLVKSRMDESIQSLSDVFEHMWPVRTPGDDRNARMHSPLAAMLVAPLIKTKEEKKAKGPQFPAEGRQWQNQRTPITEFIATTEELIEESYVLHPAHYNDSEAAVAQSERREINKTTTADGWVDTPSIPDLASGVVPEAQIEKGSVAAGRKVLAVDCEMCLTSAPSTTPQIFSLTRISIIDWDGTTLLDELVKPADPITDYLTPYSGITAAMLEKVTTTLQDIQQQLLGLLTPQTILIGHSLNSDLNALQLTHPFLVDTALLFPHPRGPPLKSSLKWLAQRYLSREIQKG